ncbi:MAG: sucrose phosphorylase [Cellulomonas sp. 73-145]|uniref:sucrose phosphorylase n=1 Tax=Cellulomonas sp. 73-145 TaxID=1895739 RepID=UPI0009269478|nr:sucrose phosphorylase [Cellulomonas sp. 73-145]OJV59634.1 MAG: sucrose phosphorylase [Cellulomonas sp. 73-145]
MAGAAELAAATGTAGAAGDVLAGVHLLAYTDRLGGDLAGMRRLLTTGPLDRFSGVHLLPFFTPFDGDDAGFDPVDHGTVDPCLGTWADVRALADDGLALTADLIVNHVSARSREFTDWLAHGTASPWDGMFLTYDRVFPHGGTEADITRIYRPRGGLPFTPYQQADGTRRLVWTTFLPSQVDLDVDHPVAREYLRRIMRTLAAAGVRIVRLDAVGYAVKTPGTDSFVTPETLRFVREAVAMAHEEGLVVLVEVHAHVSQQQAVAELVDLVYDFALPPLLLHAMGTGRIGPLVEWLEVRPRNTITVLDTHDGIGVVDAGPGAGRPGLLDEEEMAALFARAAELTGGASDRMSQRVAWTRVPHQIASTFLSVLGGDATALVLARAVQVFLPGLPQVYYVGLLGGLNDVPQYERTGQGREANRHRYTAEELRDALTTEVARAQLALVALRTEHPAFAGEHSVEVLDEHRIVLHWTAGEHRVRLIADFTPGRPQLRVAATTPEGTVEATSVAELAAWDAVAAWR